MGSSIINALKPIVSALNTVMAKIIQFAEVVSGALGAIFGWKYQSGGGGTISDDLADASDYASGVSDGLGGAAGNAKKLKQQLSGIDELNVLSSDDSGSGGGGSGGGGGGSTSTETDAGEWVETETIWEKYTSTINSLYKLGEYIGDTLKETLQGIDWDSVYEGARLFGSGLSSFLDGLISPELFYEVGRTIANSLNTVLYAELTFAKRFDFTEFGESLGESINGFFLNFDFSSLAQSINEWADGLKETIISLIKTVKWSDITKAINEFFTELEFDTIAIGITLLTIKKIGAVTLAKKALEKLGASVGSFTVDDFVLTIQSISFGGGMPAIMIGDQLLASLEEYIEENFGTEILDAIGAAVTVATTTSFGAFIGGPIGALGGAIVGALIMAIYNSDEMDSGFEGIGETIRQKLSDATENLRVNIGVFVEDVKKAVQEKWNSAKTWWDKQRSKLSEIKFSFEDLLDRVKELWEEVKKWWDERPKLSDVDFSIEDLVGNISELWSDITSWWNRKPSLKEILFGKEDLKSSVSTIWSNTTSFWNNKTNLSQVNFTLKDVKGMVSTAWQNAQTFWNNKGSLSSISFSVNDILSPIKSAINSLKSWWNSNKPSLNLNFSLKLPTLQMVWDTWSDMGKIAQRLGLPGIPKFYVYWQYYADGGFPVPGSYFVAGENGVPEMLGTVGGRTAVASGREITGIADAVYSTSQTEVALLRQQNQLLQALLSKEFGITTDEIGKSARKYAKEYYQRTGNEAYSF